MKKNYDQKKLEISHASQILTNDRQILVLFLVIWLLLYWKNTVQNIACEKRGQDLKKSLVSYHKSKKQQGPVLKQKSWLMHATHSIYIKKVSS